MRRASAASVQKPDLCVIGGGAGGLSVAAVAAQLGLEVVLVERGAMGGDCLNFGCVPSKALLAAAGHAQAVRDARTFGIQAGEPKVDWRGVRRHVAEVIGAIAPNDSVERFEKLGVRVVRAHGRFLDENTLEAGDETIRARRYVIATGSRPFIPPIPGLDRVRFLTNETIFALDEPVRHLIVIGAGPIGIEMAQAHCRLGAKVTVLEAARILMKDDPELAGIVIDRLAEEGVDFHEGVRNLELEPGEDGNVTVRFQDERGARSVAGSHLLIATGRRANTEGLNLEAAGVELGPRGIEVDARLRTTNRRVYAIGDVAGPYPFTHMAAYQAGIVIRNMLFRLPAKVDYSAVPWVTYTDPELAHVGMSEEQARERGVEVRVLSMSFAENDRAQTERRTEGRIKVVADRRGRVLGAGIVGLHAGELIQPWVLAVSRRMKLSALASMIAPYPTLAEINKRIAGKYYADRLFSPRMRRLVRFLQRF